MSISVTRKIKADVSNFKLQVLEILNFSYIFFEYVKFVYLKIHLNL